MDKVRISSQGTSGALSVKFEHQLTQFHVLCAWRLYCGAARSRNIKRSWSMWSFTLHHSRSGTHGKSGQSVCHLAFPHINALMQINYKSEYTKHERGASREADLKRPSLQCAGHCARPELQCIRVYESDRWEHLVGQREAMRSRQAMCTSSHVNKRCGM